MSDLTKWPRLLVSGVSVTREQANDILIRTCVPSYLRGNDRQWDDLVGRIMGFGDLRDAWHEIPELREDSKKRIAWLRERWAAQDARAKELGIIGLEYLYNSRISSSWIGGSYGWCDWSGNISTDSYNIGKWPSTEEVTAEWGQIAQEFPFLNLTAQLVTDENEGELAGEWRVKDGTVTHNPAPAERLRFAGPQVDETERIMSGLADVMSGRPGRERGVSPERLMEAVNQVEQAMRERRAR